MGRFDHTRMYLPAPIPKTIFSLFHGVQAIKAEFRLPIGVIPVISSCNIAPYNRTDREACASRNNSAGFSRISAKMPFGTGKWSQNWGDPGVYTCDTPDNENWRDHIRELLLEKAPSPIPCIYMGGKENK